MSTILKMIPNLHKNYTELNALMDDSKQSTYELGYLVLISLLWILVFLTVTGILKWECCNDCISRLRQRIRFNMTDTTGSPRVQFIQRIGLADNAMVRMIFQTNPPSQNLSTVDSSIVPANTTASRSELV